MRRFIIFHDANHYPDIDKGEDRPTTLKMYDRENLLVLFDELGILYQKRIGNDSLFPIKHDKELGYVYSLKSETPQSDEDFALGGVNDCNGDGDDWWNIGEIIGNELKILVE